MHTSSSFHTSPERQVLIVSDAHLPLDNRRGGPGQLERFRNLVNQHRDSLELLVLLGDIFDFWYEWTHVIPKRATGLLYDLHDIVRDGVPVHFFAGNHDFKITGFLEKEIGLTVHMDEWTCEIDGKRVYFRHGDGLAASDNSYRRMKRMFRNPAVQWLFGRLLHPDLAMVTGRLISNLGERKRLAHLTYNPTIQEYHATAGRILALDYDLVVLGHTHRQELIEMKNGWYHNPGIFFKSRCYSVIEGDLPDCRVWK